MASSEERLRELLAKEGPRSAEDKQAIERIFELSEYECMLCMINDYSPGPHRNPDHTH